MVAYILNVSPVCRIIYDSDFSFDESLTIVGVFDFPLECLARKSSASNLVLKCLVTVGDCRLFESALPFRSRLSCERLLCRQRRVGKTNRLWLGNDTREALLRVDQC